MPVVEVVEEDGEVSRVPAGRLDPEPTSPEHADPYEGEHNEANEWGLLGQLIDGCIAGGEDGDPVVAVDAVVALGGGAQVGWVEVAASDDDGVIVVESVPWAQMSLLRHGSLSLAERSAGRRSRVSPTPRLSADQVVVDAALADAPATFIAKPARRCPTGSGGNVVPACRVANVSGLARASESVLRSVRISSRMTRNPILSWRCVVAKLDRIRVVGLLLSLVLAVAACGTGDASEEGAADATADDAGATTGDVAAADADSETLVIAVEGEPTSLNPIFGDVYGSFNGDHWPIFASLLSYDAELVLAPDLAAESPQVSDDGLTVTVPLREDVTWHDGEAFDAEDVVFSYEAVLDPDVATALRDRLFTTLDGVEAVDEYTVAFTLNRLDPAFGDKLTMGIAPEHLLADEDLNTTSFNVAPVGNGPFVFEEFREGERVVVTANPDYHLGEVGLERVVFTFVGDENVRVARLEAGEIDVDAVGLTPRIAERFAGDDRYEIVGVPGEQFTFNMPTDNPVLADPLVRQAVGLAIDREGLTEALFGEGGRPSWSVFQPQHWAYDDSVVYDHDPAEAARLLEEAGWEEGAEGILERVGESLALTYVHGSAAMDQNGALFISEALRGLGMAVDLEVVESFSDRNERVAEGAVTSGRPGNAFDPELELYNAFHSDRLDDDDPGTNRTKIDSQQVDQAIAEGASSYDRDERREAYSRLQEALREDGSVQYLVQRDYQLVVSSRVEGLDPGSSDNHLHGWSRALLWNLHEWELS